MLDLARFRIGRRLPSDLRLDGSGRCGWFECLFTGPNHRLLADRLLPSAHSVHSNQEWIAGTWAIGLGSGVGIVSGGDGWRIVGVADYGQVLVV